MTKTIPTSKGQSALVDDCDYDFLSQWKWYLCGGYAKRKKYKCTIDGKEKHYTVQMHRLIMGEPVEMLVDHINGDKLDNRRDNLRICNKSGNVANALKRKNGITSQYKGVYWCKTKQGWFAEAAFNGKVMRLGRFPSEIAAAVAYNHAAIKLQGEFARINVIPNR